MGEKKITLLHINDIHGDFLTEEIDGKQVGGISMLSGYLKKVRKEEKNVIFAIAGDMFKGSIIDSEYKGLSTIELMNHLHPDVATLGNHEVDYGLAHLLFLEKCARFPIINANLFITTNHVRLFRPYTVIRRDGIRFLFIGIITDEILNSTKSENIIGSFVDVREAAREVDIICDTYKTTEIDYTVILSHIGLDKDRELAAALSPTSGVDLIIGAHTHTLLTEPVYVNDIPIVQTGTGTNQIGRIELSFDSDSRAIKSFDYKIVPIDSDHCDYDLDAQKVIEAYKNETDMKYAQVLTTFKRKLTHPSRYQETELGNLFADLIQDGSSFDLMMLASGSLRLPELGPVIQLQDLKTFFPYDDPLHLVEVTGKQLKDMVAYVCREEAFGDGAHTEFYQYSKALRFVWSRGKQCFLEFTVNGETPADDAIIKVGIQDYHFNNFESFFGLPLEEVAKNRRPRVIASSCASVFEELLSGTEELDAHVEGRINIVE